MPNLCTCLIPTYNEGEKLLETISRLKKTKVIYDFVCVDDGSTDGSINLIKKKFPDVKLIMISKNIGKSDAVREGLRQVKTEYVLLFDADIRNIISEEVGWGLKKVFAKKPDMVIFRRMKSPFFPKIVRSDTLLSGERILKTDIAKKAMNKNPIPHKYQMEAAINQFCTNSHADVYWYPLSTLNTFKSIKMGLIKGILGDLNTFFKEATYVGRLNYLKQILFFCKKEL